MNRRATFLAAVWIALGCSKEEPGARGPDPAVTPVAQPQADVPSKAVASASHPHMNQLYDEALRMRRAVIAGDLGAFTTAAKQIPLRELLPGTPEGWKPHVDALRRSAERGPAAASVEQAAAVLGDIGSSCAACHRSLGGPKFTLDVPPVEGVGVKRHMARHQWAADRMWDGLIAPSTPIWVKGAEVMADARLTSDEVAPGVPEVDAIARRVHFLANAARLLPDDQWGRAYGEFVATCAVCHEKTGVR